ncbi:hypothetical protein JMJ35_006913 [Cladonia borealis]|uniref:Uncharacterized protein n=1 Tax=Cladonia borealis TaxID=184061 RepID=A0AA39QXX8_9LECA|nr:hypothetical protein JMJ35_006913 [Cladonia borealis]
MKAIYHVTALLLALAAPIVAQKEVIVTTIIPVYVYVSDGVDIPYTPSTIKPTPEAAPSPPPAKASAPAAAAPVDDGAPVEKYHVAAETTSTVPPASGPVQIPSHTPTNLLSKEAAEGTNAATATVPATMVTAAPPPVADNGVLTISIVNKYSAPLSISYGDNAGSPNAIGAPQAGPLGTATTVVYPTGWAGRIYLGTINHPANSKIEGSTTGANDIDISYVDGYSVPVTCMAEGTAISGCNIDLWEQDGDCPQSLQGQSKAVCLNPMQSVPNGPAVPWFLPCQGAAYTFPNDNVANDGNTGTPQVTCCIGTEAQGCTQAPERQGKEKNVASRKRSLAEVLEERKANTPSLLPQQHGHLRRHAHKARSHGHHLVRDLKDLV